MWWGNSSLSIWCLSCRRIALNWKKKKDETKITFIYYSLANWMAPPWIMCAISELSMLIPSSLWIQFPLMMEPQYLDVESWIQIDTRLTVGNRFLIDDLLFVDVKWNKIKYGLLRSVWLHLWWPVSRSSECERYLLLFSSLVNYLDESELCMEVSWVGMCANVRKMIYKKNAVFCRLSIFYGSAHIQWYFDGINCICEDKITKDDEKIRMLNWFWRMSRSLKKKKKLIIYW